MNKGDTPARDRVGNAVEALLKATVTGLTGPELVAATGASSATLWRALKRMRDNGTVRTYKDPYNTRLVRYQLATNIAPTKRRK